MRYQLRLSIRSSTFFIRKTTRLFYVLAPTTAPPHSTRYLNNRRRKHIFLLRYQKKILRSGGACSISILGHQSTVNMGVVRFKGLS